MLANCIALSYSVCTHLKVTGFLRDDWAVVSLKLLRLGCLVLIAIQEKCNVNVSL